MGKIKGTIRAALRKRPVFALVLYGLVFAASLALLFTQEKRRLDREFQGMIMDSLNIHTQADAARINREITDAGRALRTAETMFRMAQGGGV